ncbi:hypothetical protein D3C71_2101810 [compost metagenome]
MIRVEIAQPVLVQEGNGAFAGELAHVGAGRDHRRCQLTKLPFGFWQQYLKTHGQYLTVDEGCKLAEGAMPRAVCF